MSDDQSDPAPTGDPAPDGTDPHTLDARLKAAQAREAERSSPRPGTGADANYRAGNRVLADLLGGLIGGLFLGWVIDQFAGTQPWGLLGMMTLGIIVAFRNIVRNSGQTGV